MKGWRRIVRHLMQSGLALAGLAAGLSATGFPRPAHTVEILHNYVRGLSPDRWVNGYLPMFESTRTPGTPAEVWMYDRQGREVIRKTRILPEDAYRIVPWDVAALPDGRLLLSADLWSSAAEAASVLCFVKPPGVLEKIVRTEIAADSLGVAPNGEIWGFGAPAALRWDREARYETLRKWSPEGRQLFASLPRGSFATQFPPALYSSTGGPSRVLVGENRLGLYSSQTGEWLELAPATGEVLARFRLEQPRQEGNHRPAPLLNAVMTASGRVYARFATGRFAKQIFFQLDGEARQWKPLPPDRFPPDFRGLSGADGEQLILRSGPGLYGWFPAPDVVGGQAATGIVEWDAQEQRFTAQAR